MSMCICKRDFDVIVDTTNNGECYFMTIAIPTFKRFDLLKEALDSVFAQQFPFSVEVLVVDNNPDTKEIAKQIVMKYKFDNFRYVVNDENIGMFGNWNQCITLSKGKYMMILNDDDLLKPSFSEMLTGYIDNQKIKDGIISFSDEVLDQRKPELKRIVPCWLNAARKFKLYLKTRMSKSTSTIVRTDFYFKNYIHGTLGVVFDRNMAIQLGGFDAETYPIADWDFWLRWASTYGPITRVRDSVAYYRIKENESFNPETLEKFPPAVKKMRHTAIAAGLLPSFLSVFTPYLDKYEVMLGQVGFGDPEKYKFGIFHSLFFYASMLFQSVLAKAISYFYRK